MLLLGKQFIIPPNSETSFVAQHFLHVHELVYVEACIGGGTGKFLFELRVDGSIGQASLARLEEELEHILELV